jgi:translation initiation factor IF-1
MKAIEISCKGRTLFTAGLEDGIVTARLIVRNQVDPVWFDVDGRDALTGGHARWAHISVQPGDEFTVKLVDIDAALPAEAAEVRHRLG